MSGRAEFRSWLTSAALRRRRAAWWGVVALALAALAGALALIAATDALLTPAGWPLVVLVALPLAIAGSVAVVMWRRASRLDADTTIAALADEERPDFEDRAKTAVDLLSRPEPGPFDDLVLAETTRQISIVDLPETLNEERAARSRRFAAAGAAAVVAGLVFAWPALRDGAMTARVLMVPGALELSVEPGDVRVPIGRTLTITARASVLPRTPGRAIPLLTVTTPGDEGSAEMVPGESAFTYVTPPVNGSFTYRVALGPATSREYRVEALPYPGVETIDLSYRYPSWSGLEPRDERDGGDVYGPEGTRVGMRVTVDKPTREAALVMGDGSRVALAPVEGDATRRVFETALNLTRDDSYRVAVIDDDGLGNERSTEYFIRVMDDAPPDVRIVRPAGDQRVTPLAEVAIEARADDDHGVRGLDIVYAVRGERERVVPVGGGGGRSATGRHLIYLEDLDVKPGDFVSFYARARDIARGSQSTEGRSDIFFLEVKPFEEEFAAAQSMAQAGAGAASRQLQSLAAAQKEIIVATWKLERRANAGRSGADLRAVADAQRELQQRAAQAAGQMTARPEPRRSRRNRSPFPIPEPQEEAVAETPADDPASLLARAGEAMTRAAGELDAGRPQAALEHENAALNELLRIEAQVRRREIMQAQNQGGGGGGGGGNQDLSALFDRELQRQQRTNYESRSSASAQQQQGEEESEALRRVREMAQRQEAMRREQEALARANVTAEERKRRLERLRRDQEELQRQVQQLARDLQREQTRQSGQSQQGEQGEQAQQGQPGQPGQQGQQSAQGQQGQQRQQGAQGQRSGQAGQQGQSSGSSSGEQNSQGAQAGSAADAMREAARSLEQEDLARAGEQSARAGDALRELEREMQARADAARARAAAGEERRERGASAQSEAERAETRRLTDALDEARATRERLADLERRIRELQNQNQNENPNQNREPNPRNPEPVEPGELPRLLEQFNREAARARAMAGGTPESASALSRSAPGTEQWKQDFSRWESMRNGVVQALEAHEAAVAQRLAEQLAAERVQGGYDARTPEAWRRLVAQYYQAIVERRPR